MGATSNVFNFVSCVAFVCCLVIYKPNSARLFWGLTKQWRMKEQMLSYQGAGHCPRTRFHQTEHLCGFRLRPALWGGESCQGWGDACSALGNGSRWQAAGSGPCCFWIHLVALSTAALERTEKHIGGVLLKWNLLNTHPSQHPHTLRFASRCGFQQHTRVPFTFSWTGGTSAAGLDHGWLSKPPKCV